MKRETPLVMGRVFIVVVKCSGDGDISEYRNVDDIIVKRLL